MTDAAATPAEYKNRIVGHGSKPAKDFEPHPLNWRTHPAVQRAALKGALTEVGWVQDVIVNKTTGHVLDGHARIEETPPDEDVPYGWFEGHRAAFYGDPNATTVWDVSRTGGDGNERVKHPTQKPVEVYGIPIRNHARSGEVVYDAFAGSGTAVISAELEGRRAFVVEVDRVYAQVVIERWQNFTGRKAKRSRRRK